MTKIEVKRITLRGVPALAWASLAFGIIAAVAQLDTEVSMTRFILTGTILLASTFAATKAGAPLRIDRAIVEVGSVRRRR